MDRTQDSAMIALRHAVENASNDPITDDGILAILRGAGENGSHLRAIFGDASLQALSAAGAARGIPLATILTAFAAARTTAAAANGALDAAIKTGWSLLAGRDRQVTGDVARCPSQCGARGRR